MEDLLSPRYKVIADWPDNSKRRVGEIITTADAEWQKNYIEWLEKYPHLFKKMDWWEKRKLEDMPNYIKNSVGVFKAEEWDVFPTVINDAPTLGVRVKIDSNQLPVDVSDYLPATEEEYNNRDNLTFEIF